MSTLDLEGDLADLATAVEAPEIHVAALVRQRLEAGEGRAPTGRRRWLGLGALMAAVGMVVLPGPRAAIADWLSLDGVEIRQVEDDDLRTLPSPPELGFGREVSMEEAVDALGREPLLLDGRPTRVFLSSRYPTFEYGFLYLSQFVSTDAPWVIKKLVPNAASVESVTVNGGPGFWIEGPHSVGFGTEPERAVGDVLLWEQDGLTLRLEGATSKSHALELAGTLRR